VPVVFLTGPAALPVHARLAPGRSSSRWLASYFLSRTPRADHGAVHCCRRKAEAEARGENEETDSRSSRNRACQNLVRSSVIRPPFHHAFNRGFRPGCGRLTRASSTGGLDHPFSSHDRRPAPASRWGSLALFPPNRRGFLSQRGRRPDPAARPGAPPGRASSRRSGSSGQVEDRHPRGSCPIATGAMILDKHGG